MDEIKPNASFIFTKVNSLEFHTESFKKVFTSKHYTIPDYWFTTEQELLDFSTNLKNSITFMEYLISCIEYAIINNLESFIACTLRTNGNLIFVQITHTAYTETIDKLIDLLVTHELYERCSYVLTLKEKFLTEFINSGKNQSYEAYEFWKPLYPHFLY